MLQRLKHLYRYRDLLITWTQREIRVRYKQSFAGGLWAIMQPLALMIIFTIVFSVFARVPTDGIPYPIFSYTALLPWTLLSSAISFGVPSLTNNLNLVTKIYFPRVILPLASIGAAFFDFLIASLIFVAMMFFYRVALTSTILWVPLLLCIQVILMMGVVFLLSAVNVFYRDVRFVIPLLLQVWLYASPVIYPLTLVPEQYRLIYMLNPMAGLIDSYRRVILQGLPPEPAYLALSAVVSMILFVIGYSYFERAEPTFADVI